MLTEQGSVIHWSHKWQAEEKTTKSIVALWEDCYARFGAGGPFLFGAFGNANAMYAPVVTRFNTYGVALEGLARAYADAILALPPMREWFARRPSSGRSRKQTPPEVDIVCRCCARAACEA